MKRLLFAVIIGTLLFGCSLPPEERAKIKKSDDKEAINDARKYVNAQDCVNGHAYEVHIYDIGGGHHMPVYIPLFDQNGLPSTCSNNDSETE